jgi:hypothetical protein
MQATEPEKYDNKISKVHTKSLENQIKFGSLSGA